VNMPLANTDGALRFVEIYEPVVLRYMEAQRVLVRGFGDKMLMFRHNKKEQEVSICPNCGGYGHTINKKCVMCIDEGITRRGDQSLIEHYSENVGEFGKTQKDAMLAAINLQEWETRQMNSNLVDAVRRHRIGEKSRRLAPSRAHMIHGNKTPGKKEVVHLSPSIPFAAFGEYTVEELKNRVDMKILMSRDDFLMARKAWDDSGFFDTSDFDLALEWVEYAKAHNLGTSEFTDEERLTEMLNFIHQHNKGDV
jgi:hypothetical protein